MSSKMQCPACQKTFMSAGGEETQCPHCQRLLTESPSTDANGSDSPRVGILVGKAPGNLDQPSTRQLTNLVTDIVKSVVNKSNPPAPSTAGWTRDVSGIGLILGMISLGITWPFQLTSLGLLLGGVGSGLAGLALFAVMLRKNPAWTLPIVSFLVSAEAFALAVMLYRLPEAPPPRPEVVRFPEIGQWQGALADQDPAVRAKALAAVGELALKLETTRGDLLKTLQDPDEKVRILVVETLGRLGAGARLAYPLIAQMAKNDASDSVRRQARQAMRKIGAPTRADLPACLTALQDARPEARIAAALSLASLNAEAGDAAEALRKALADADRTVQVCAAQALWAIMQHQPAADPNLVRDIVPVLLTSLGDDNPRNRARAAMVLADMRNSQRDVIAALMKAAGDADAEVRLHAIRALASLGRDAQEAIPQFQTALGDAEPKVRLLAAHGLWLVGQKTDGIQVLIETLKNSDAELRVHAAVILGSMGAEAGKAGPALGEALKDSDPGVRAYAAKAIYDIGPPARGALASLRDALQSPDAKVRALSANALWKMKDPASANDLSRALPDKDASVRLYVARALWASGGKAGKVLPVLQELLQPKSPERARAALALGEMGAGAGAAVADLYELLDDADVNLRSAAARALGEIGASARITFPALFELSKEGQPDKNLRQVAEAAAKKIGPPTKNDVHALIAALEHPGKPKFRAAAAAGLWFLQRDARPAIAALCQRLIDPKEDDAVRKTSALALAAVGRGHTGPETVQALITALNDKDDDLRANVAFTLGEIGDAAADAVEALNKVLNQDKDKVALRVQVARALWKIAAKGKGRLPANLIAIFCQGLAEKDGEMALAAAETLGQIGQRAEEDRKEGALAKELSAALKETAVPALSKSLEGSEVLRAAAAEALGKIGLDAESALPQLLQALESGGPELRATAAEALGKIAAAEALANKKAIRAKVAYGSLLFYGKLDTSERVQRAINGALAKIGPLGADDVGILLTLLEDKSQPVSYRSAAARVIGIIGPAGEAAVPRLARVVADASEAGSPRILAAYALGDVGPAAKKGQASLMKALQDADAGLKIAAAYALGEIFQNAGKTIQSELKALEAAATSPDANVAAAARAALKKINPGK